MLTPVTNPSALNYWLREALSRDPSLKFSEIAESDIINGGTPELILHDARLFHIDQPIDVLFSKPDFRRERKGFSSHVLGNIDQCTFVRLTDSLYIISPETAFLLEARHRSLPELIQLACDLCAIYKPDAFSPYKQIKRSPITSVNEITSYLSGINNIVGGRKARQAITYALDNSNSPMESKLASIFRPPFSLGGGGIYDISLNQVSRLSQNAATFLGRDYCICDICSNKKKVVFEYDSNLTHLTADQHSYDKKRSTALQMSGYNVFTITADNLKSHSSLDQLILSARDALGLRTHMDRFEKFQKIRWDAYDALFFRR